MPALDDQQATVVVCPGCHKRCLYQTGQTKVANILTCSECGGKVLVAAPVTRIDVDPGEQLKLIYPPEKEDKEAQGKVKIEKDEDEEEKDRTERYRTFSIRVTASVHELIMLNLYATKLKLDISGNKNVWLSQAMEYMVADYMASQDVNLVAMARQWMDTGVDPRQKELRLGRPPAPEHPDKS